MYHIPSFAGGYASRRAEGRLDLENYRTFQKDNLNYLITPSGAATKRPGIPWIGEGLGEQEGRWITMSNGELDDDIFLLVEGRVFRLTDGVLVEQTVEDTAAAASTQPLTDAELPDFQWYDVHTIANGHYVVMVHEDILPQYMAIKDATTVIIDDLNSLAALSFPTTPATTTATFCTTPGSDCPGVVCLYQGRLIFARTADDPGYISASQVGSLTDFAPTAASDGGWEGYITLTADYYINWITPWKTLAVGTNNGVWLLADSNIDATTVEQYVWYSKQKSNKTIALGLDATLLYANITGQAILGMTFNEQTSGYDIPTLMELADDISISGAKVLGYQSSPYQILWVLNENGTISAMTYSRNGISWHKHIFGAARTKDIFMAKYGGKERLLVLNISDTVSPDAGTDGNYYWLAGIMDPISLDPNSLANLHLDFYKEFEKQELSVSVVTTGANTLATVDEEISQVNDFVYGKITAGDDDWIDREFRLGDFTPASTYEYELLDVLGNAFDSTDLAGTFTAMVTGYRTMYFWGEYEDLAKWAVPAIENAPTKYATNYQGLHRNGEFEVYDGYVADLNGIVIADTTQIIYDSGAVGVTIPSLLIPFSPYTRKFNRIGIARVLMRLSNTYGFGMLTESLDGYVDVISFDINEVETFDTPAEPFNGIAEKDFQTAHSYEPKVVMFHDIPAPCIICGLSIDLGDQDLQ